jgi:CRISPR/Cas system-associated exonuclease Cas4 (RecB family)
LYAVVTGHWSSWQAARVEVRQDEEDDRAVLDRLDRIERLLREEAP